MALNAAFIFLSPSADPERDRTVVATGEVDLHVVGVANYEQADRVAAQLVESDAVTAIELCGGFGVAGTARVQAAVGEGIPVGVVRFDVHPGLGNVSGDTVFA